jgi:hypothetical protein
MEEIKKIIWSVRMKETCWDEYRGFIVSANSKEEVIKMLKISKTKEEASNKEDDSCYDNIFDKNRNNFSYSNLYEDNIEFIKEIGTYNKNVSEVILTDFKAG